MARWPNPASSRRAAFFFTRTSSAGRRVIRAPAGRRQRSVDIDGRSLARDELDEAGGRRGGCRQHAGRAAGGAAGLGDPVAARRPIPQLRGAVVARRAPPRHRRCRLEAAAAGAGVHGAGAGAVAGRGGAAALADEAVRLRRPLPRGARVRGALPPPQLLPRHAGVLQSLVDEGVHLLRQPPLACRAAAGRRRRGGQAG